VPPSRKQIALIFAPLVREAVPAVVGIHSRKQVAQRVDPLLADPFPRFFFEQFGRRPAPRSVTSLDSGVILGSDGADRREFSARMIAGNRSGDLASDRIAALERAGR
jgi:S1-C subfamily serine protease